MSYSEENGQVVLRMSREDYGVVLKQELRRRKTKFWGRHYFITPRLVDWVHGDGLQLIYFTPLNTRPNYYVVRIDSKVSLDNSDEPRCAEQSPIRQREHSFTAG